jgi:hypothetical protein
MNYWNKEKKKGPWNPQKKRTNWNQTLKTAKGYKTKNEKL